MATVKTYQEGDDKRKKAYNYFISKGYSPQVAAGIVGNLVHESGLNTTIEGDIGYKGGSSFGAAQWRGERLQRLKKRYGESWTDFNNQLEFVDWELRNTHKNAGEKLLGAKDIHEAGQIFSDLYEIPKKKYYENEARRLAVERVGKDFLGQQYTENINSEPTNFAETNDFSIFGYQQTPHTRIGAGLPTIEEDIEEKNTSKKEENTSKEKEALLQRQREYQFLQDLSQGIVQQEARQQEQIQRPEVPQFDPMQEYEEISAFVENPIMQQGGLNLNKLNKSIEQRKKITQEELQLINQYLGQYTDKGNKYNKEYEPQDSFYSNNVKPILRKLIGRGGTDKDTIINMPPNKMKFFTSGEVPIDSKIIIGGDYVEKTPTAYPKKMYPKEMYTTKGEKSPIDFKTQLFYGVKDGNITIDNFKNFEDSDIIVPLRDGFGGEYNIKKQKRIPKDLIDKAKLVRRKAKDLLGIANFNFSSEEFKKYRESNDVIKVQKELEKYIGAKSKYLLYEDDLTEKLNDNVVLNNQEKIINSFGSKILVFSPKTNNHRFISKKNEEERNKALIEFKEEYPDANYIILDNGRYQNYLVSEEGITEEDVDDYMQNSFKTKKGTGYNFAYQQGGKIPTEKEGVFATNGKPVIVPSPNIDMKGVDYPILGISEQTGEEKIMLPNMQYFFNNTKNVLEIPMMQEGQYNPKTTDYANGGTVNGCGGLGQPPCPEKESYGIKEFAEDAYQAWFNPKNWGVTDYTNEKDFNSAYTSARRNGEKEFMYRNRRYSSNYNGTPEQQLKETGITDERLGLQSKIGNRAYNTIKPSIYHTDKDVKTHINNFIAGRSRFDNDEYEKISKELKKVNEEEPDNIKKLKNLYEKLNNYNNDFMGFDDPYSEDGWNIYLGRPQINNTFSISKYQPSKAKDKNIQYYSLPNTFKEELLKRYNQGYVKEGVNDEIIFDHVFGEGASQGRVLGQFTVSKGKDDKGEYISYYDKYDLSPNIPIIGNTKLDKIVGKPFEIYDRIYLNNKKSK